MIQRIQSLYLLVAAILIGLLFVVPFSQAALFENSMSGLTALGDTIATALVACSVLASIVAIFLFSNRKLQITVSYIAMLFCLAIAGYMGWQTYNTSGVSLYMGAALPLAAVNFIFMAVRAIQKDEALVKDMDRLR